jgi:hypothetical protein
VACRYKGSPAGEFLLKPCGLYLRAAYIPHPASILSDTAGCLRSGLTMIQRFSNVAILLGISGLATAFAPVQTSGGSITLRWAYVSPFIALLAGILILIIPRLLNYIVAIYLILVGLIGIFGR